MKNMKMMKLMCVSARRSGPQGVKENDIVIYEQYIWAGRIDAIIQPDALDKMPQSECIVVYGGQTFHCTEPMDELVERVNEAVKEED